MRYGSQNLQIELEKKDVLIKIIHDGGVLTQGVLSIAFNNSLHKFINKIII